MSTKIGNPIQVMLTTLMTTMLLAATGWAQLEFVEIMNDSLDPQDSSWEWIEVRNNSSASINLDGYVLYDQSNHLPLQDANIVAGLSPTTIIPANSVGVLYNAQGLGTDGARFRDAWNLLPSVPLIAVQGQVATLNNDGDRVALWPNLGAYLADIEDPDGDSNFAMVATPTMTSVLLDFQSGFPTGAGVSFQWSGMGLNSDPANWASSVAGVGDAYASTRTITPGDLVGVGNPGVIAGGTAPAGLLITEVMYDPAAQEADNEWVEVFNNTGSAIDFGANPYTFFDHDTTDLTAPNVTSGTIPQGGVAILHSDNIPLADMQAAWGASNNYIPVSDFLQGNLGLANGGDSFGIWNDFNNYLADAVGNTFNLATATLTYDDDPSAGWPNNDGAGSIWLSSLSADPTDGSSWLLSDPGDGISFEGRLDLEDHIGGDVGSPGVFAGGPPTGLCDLNGDTMCDNTDLRLLYDNIASGTATNADIGLWLADAGTLNGKTYLPGDTDLDGNVGGGDFTAVASNFGGSGLPGAYWDQGNFDGNTGGNFDVGGGDFTALASNFGSSSIASVPEPHAVGWLLVGLPLLIGVRRLRTV